MRILLRRIDKPRFHRVFRNVRTVLLHTLLIHYLHLGETTLPNFSQHPELFLYAKGEPALDQLHCLFDRHAVMNREEHVDMIGHDDKIVKPEFLFNSQ